MLFDKISPYLRIMQQLTTSEWGMKEYLGKIADIEKITVLDVTYNQIEQEIFTLLNLKDSKIKKEIQDVLLEMRSDWNSILKLEQILKRIEKEI